MEKGSTNVVDLLSPIDCPKKDLLACCASSTITHQIQVKYKDLNCRTISIVMGDQLFRRALLDLGANVNLLPFIEYESVRLGELKPTNMAF